MIEPHIEMLRDKHARIEQTISQESARPHPDEARLHELKREKLKLKDTISSLSNGHSAA
ncbi:YdcH family protein [Aquibaculum sediminis]|uniref:YdcH family protein n=1 Tax=Aquibaculum sediminis TaxID=3231907 RepID=UPI0034527625